VQRQPRQIAVRSNEAAVIVERFAGDWFYKERLKAGGIERTRVAAFTGGAMKKLIGELKKGAHPDGP
jgi:hypothetical protein